MDAPGDAEGATIETTGAPARLTGTTTATLVESPPTIVKTALLTTSDACGLAVDLIRQIAVTRADLETAHGESDALRAQLAAVEAECNVYREIVSVAVNQLHEKDIEFKRQRASHNRLLDDYRALRRKGPAAT